MSARVGFEWLGQVTSVPAVLSCSVPPARGVPASATDVAAFNDWRSRDPGWFRYLVSSNYNYYGFTLHCPKFLNPAGQLIGSFRFDSPQPYGSFGTVGGIEYRKYAMWIAACRGCQGLPLSPLCYPPFVLDPVRRSCFECVTAGQVPMTAPDGTLICCQPNEFPLRDAQGITHCVPRLRAAPPRPRLRIAPAVLRPFVLRGSPGQLGQACPQDALCGGNPNGPFWDGTKCVASKVCATGYSLNSATNCCEQVGEVSLHNKHFYRGRWLIGYDPAKNTCEQVRDSLNAAFDTAQSSNSAWPWAALKVFLEPFQTWPSTRTGSPYETTNYCLLYVQGQWVQADTKQSALQLGAWLAPNTRPIDFWDDTADPLAQSPLYDYRLTGCGTGATLTFDPATGNSECRSVSAPAPAPSGSTVTGHVYRSRWFVQQQPSQGLNTCDDVALAVQGLVTGITSQPNPPWTNISVSPTVPAGWESAHVGFPFELAPGWCVLYIEGVAGTPTPITQAASSPIAAVADFWDHTASTEIKSAPALPANCAVPCTYDPATGTFTGSPIAISCGPNAHPTAGGCACDTGYHVDAAGNCVPSAVAPPPAAPPPAAVPVAAAKPSNTALYVGLGAAALVGLLLLAGRGGGAAAAAAGGMA